MEILEYTQGYDEYILKEWYLPELLNFEEFKERTKPLKKFEEEHKEFQKIIVPDDARWMFDPKKEYRFLGSFGEGGYNCIYNYFETRKIRTDTKEDCDFIDFITDKLGYI